MTGAEPEPVQLKSESLSKALFPYLMVAVNVLLVAIMVWWLATHRDPTLAERERKERAESLREAVQAERTLDKELQASEAANVRHRALATQCKVLRDGFEALKTAQLDWQERVTELRSNEDGRRIASSEALRAQYRRLVDRFQLYDSTAVLATLAAVHAESDARGKDQAPAHPDVAKLAEVTFAKSTLDEQSAMHKGLERDLLSLLRRLKEEGVKPSEKTLQLVFEEHEAAVRKVEQSAVDLEAVKIEAAKSAERVRSEIQQERHKAELELANLRQQNAAELKKLADKAEAERKERNLELQQLAEKHDSEMRAKRAQFDAELKAAEAQALAAKQVTEASASKTTDATRRAELLVKAQSAETQELLSPFLSKGFWQPRGFPKARLPAEKSPMSLSAIKGNNTMPTTMEGAVQLAMMACHADNDRPHWGGPAGGYNYPGKIFDWLKKNPGELEKVTKAQKLLAELGDLMVEEGMLLK